MSTLAALSAELEKERELRERMLNCVQDVVYVLDLQENKLVFISSEISLLLGYPRKSIQSWKADLFPRLMHPEDLALFRQLEAWMTEHTGYPTVSGYDEFLYEPDKPLRGDVSEYAYNQRGALSYVIELWDLFKRIGMTRPTKFVQYYDRFSQDDLVKLAWWDRDENEGRCFPTWRTFVHPQLGPVEIGGIDPRFGIWNPPFHELPALCTSQSQVFLRVAAMAPRVRIARVDRQTLPGGLTRVDVRVENEGYLGSYGVPSAKALVRSRGMVVPIFVLESHAFEPVFLSSMYDGMTWPAVMVSVIVA